MLFFEIQAKVCFFLALTGKKTLSGLLCLLFVLHGRHAALPLEELSEGRLVGKVQHLGHLLHGQ